MPTWETDQETRETINEGAKTRFSSSGSNERPAQWMGTPGEVWKAKLSFQKGNNENDIERWRTATAKNLLAKGKFQTLEQHLHEAMMLWPGAGPASVEPIWVQEIEQRRENTTYELRYNMYGQEITQFMDQNSVVTGKTYTVYANELHSRKSLRQQIITRENLERHKLSKIQVRRLAKDPMSNSEVWSRTWNSNGEEDQPNIKAGFWQMAQYQFDYKKPHDFWNCISGSNALAYQLQGNWSYNKKNNKEAFIKYVQHICIRLS